MVRYIPRKKRFRSRAGVKRGTTVAGGGARKRVATGASRAAYRPAMVGPIIRKTRANSWAMYEAGDIKSCPDVIKHNGAWREVKAVTVDTAATTVGYDSVLVYDICPIAVGDDIANRTGRSIIALQWEQRFILKSASQECFWRVIVFRDDAHVYGGADPAFGDLMNDGGGAASSFMSLYDYNEKHRFHIYYDKTFYAGNTGDQPVRFEHITIPMRHVIKYEGTATTDNATGSVYVLVTNNVLAAAACQFTSEGAFRFCDDN